MQIQSKQRSMGDPDILSYYFNIYIITDSTSASLNTNIL